MLLMPGLGAEAARIVQGRAAIGSFSSFSVNAESGQPDALEMIYPGARSAIMAAVPPRPDPGRASRVGSQLGQSTKSLRDSGVHGLAAEH
jgi:hypothetical protein